MNRREFVIATFGCAVALSAGTRAGAQKKALEPDLGALADGKGINHSNRTITRLTDGARKGVRFSEAEGEFPVYLAGVEFANGTIELDIKGRDVQGASFVGVAFHGVDGKTYDGIYFRPFNFKTEDAARRVRAVQYISHPVNTWQKLRAEHPNKYEKGANPVPDPNGWFHARVVVASPKVSVFIDDGKEPALVVEQLSDRRKGLVGLWVGNGSGGDFANLKITPA